MWAGNQAAMDYLADRGGYSRVGHHGGAGGRWIDAHDWTIASFFQHDSRDGDPHLHIHNVIHNRVECADGVWRTIDGKAMRAFKGAASAVGERTAEAHMYATLGVLAEMRPDGKARELVGVAQEVCALLSSRRRAIAPRAAELIEAFEARHSRAAWPLERDRLAHQAMITTRRSKTTHETIEQRLDRVETQIAAELGTGLGQVAHDILAMAGAERAEPAQWSPQAVIETALAAVQANQAGYSRSELTREISDTLPANLGITDGDEIAALLDYITDRALELATGLDAAKPGDVALAEQFRLADGTSAFVGPGRARYATPEHIQTERLLLEAAQRRDGLATTNAAARGFVERLAESGIELGAAPARGDHRRVDLRRPRRVARRAGRHREELRARDAQPCLVGPEHLVRPAGRDPGPRAGVGHQRAGRRGAARRGPGGGEHRRLVGCPDPDRRAPRPGHRWPVDDRGGGSGGHRRVVDVRHRRRRRRTRPGRGGGGVAAAGR
jgi:hypothetical protein